MEELQGDDWRLVRPAERVPYEEIADIDPSVPSAEWFWGALERHCVAGCCGLDAFDFSQEAVRWARGDDMEKPEGYWFRPDDRGDSAQLAEDLRRLAADLRARGGEAVKSMRLNEVATARSFAELFDDLSRKLLAGP